MTILDQLKEDTAIITPHYKATSRRNYWKSVEMLSFNGLYVHLKSTLNLLFQRNHFFEYLPAAMDLKRSLLQI